MLLYFLFTAMILRLSDRKANKFICLGINLLKNMYIDSISKVVSNQMFYHN